MPAGSTRPGASCFIYARDDGKTPLAGYALFGRADDVGLPATAFAIRPDAQGRGLGPAPSVIWLRWLRAHNACAAFCQHAGREQRFSLRRSELGFAPAGRLVRGWAEAQMWRGAGKYIRGVGCQVMTFAIVPTLRRGAATTITDGCTDSGSTTTTTNTVPLRREGARRQPVTQPPWIAVRGAVGVALDDPAIAAADETCGRDHRAPLGFVAQRVRPGREGR